MSCGFGRRGTRSLKFVPVNVPRLTTACSGGREASFESLLPVFGAARLTRSLDIFLLREYEVMYAKAPLPNYIFYGAALYIPFGPV